MSEVLKDLTDSPLKLGTIVASLAVLGYIMVKGIYHGNKESQDRVYPPGPPQDLLIGNLRQYPKFRRARFGERFVNGRDNTVRVLLFR
jgi:hypothetical protein